MYSSCNVLSSRNYFRIAPRDSRPNFNVSNLTVRESRSFFSRIWRTAVRSGYNWKYKELRRQPDGIPEPRQNARVYVARLRGLAAFARLRHGNRGSVATGARQSYAYSSFLATLAVPGGALNPRPSFGPRVFFACNLARPTNNHPRTLSPLIRRPQAANRRVQFY